MSPEDFVKSHTIKARAPLVPELSLRLATQVTPLWQASEEVIAAADAPPPYWAFAWPGGQALARLILDRPESVRGRRVLDFAAGSGIAGLAAALAGAESVAGSDIDPFSLAAMRLNAEDNGLAMTVLGEDLTAAPAGGRFDLIVAGDVCYEQPMAERVMDWLHAAVAAGSEVWMGDPGRNHTPDEDLEELDSYCVPTNLELEDTEERETTVWRLLRRNIASFGGS